MVKHRRQEYRIYLRYHNRQILLPPPSIQQLRSKTRPRPQMASTRRRTHQTQPLQPRQHIRKPTGGIALIGLFDGLKKNSQRNAEAKTKYRYERNQTETADVAQTYPER